MSIYGVRRFGFILAVLFVGVLIGGSFSIIFLAIFGALCALWCILWDDARAKLLQRKRVMECE